METSPDLTGRAVGATEKGWCRAVPGGTGIAVAAAHLSHTIPVDTLNKALRHIQLTHPILRAKLATTKPNTFFFSISPTPSVQIHSFDAAATADVLSRIPDRSVSDLHALAEHEMNVNPWADVDPTAPVDIMFASVYELPGGSGSVVVIRTHTGATDRTSGRSVLRELLGLIGKKESDDVDGGGEQEVLPAVEDLIPANFKKKAIWSRGIDMFGYSLNHARSSIMPFDDTKSTRTSRFVVLDLDVDHTQKLLAACKDRGIKLSGVLQAAGLIAIIKSKNLPNKKSEINQVITLADCRKRLTKVLNDSDIGFYHSAIQNIYSVNGEENLWELSTKCYTSFSSAQDSNKDLTDMADLNFLMMKAIDNPGMTPSSSMRTALISVFEEPQMYNSSEFCQGVDVEDYVVTSSVHGIGPCIAMFDSIKDGGLLCGCLYASPLYSRKHIQEIVDDMKKILIDATA